MFLWLVFHIFYLVIVILHNMYPTQTYTFTNDKFYHGTKNTTTPISTVYTKTVNEAIENSTGGASNLSDLNIDADLDMDTYKIVTDRIESDNPDTSIVVDNNVNFNSNTLEGLRYLNSSGDLTFNQNGNCDYAFNTAAHADRTMIIKDKNNTEALVRLESNNGNGLLDMICANDGHAGLYLRSNSYIHFGTNNTERLVIKNTGLVTFRQGLECHGPMHVKIDTHNTDADVTLSADRHFVELQSQPSAIRTIYLPALSATSFGQTITFKTLFDGSGSNNHYKIQASSGDKLDNTTDGQFFMNFDHGSLSVVRGFDKWCISNVFTGV